MATDRLRVSAHVTYFLCLCAEVVVAAFLGWIVLTMAFDVLIEFCIWLDETYMRGYP